MDRVELEKARLEQVGDEAGGALRGLQRDVAGETVAHDHVVIAARELVALDEAGEGERQAAHLSLGGLTQDLRGVANLARALLVLAADVEQADARPLQLEDDACIGGAHDRELDEVARIALGIGAEVEHDDVVVAQRRQRRGERRSVDARAAS